MNITLQIKSVREVVTCVLVCIYWPCGEASYPHFYSYSLPKYTA